MGSGTTSEAEVARHLIRPQNRRKPRQCVLAVPLLGTMIQRISQRQGIDSSANFPRKAAYPAGEMR